MNYLFSILDIVLRLDHQPLFGKGARAPPPLFSGRDADQTRESGGNRAYIVLGPSYLCLFL